MKLGVRIKIDVTKIDKARLYEGKKGKYLDAVAFINPDEPGQYGDHGMVKQEAKADGQEEIILGNVKVFWRDDKSQPVNSNESRTQSGTDKPERVGFHNFDDDIPFN